MRLHYIFAILLNAAIVFSGFAQSENSEYVDLRDNTKYSIVKIGEQWWFAQNLAFETTNSDFYEKNTRNKNFFGRLYTWDAADSACPSGWHLPSDQEWQQLELSIGLSEKVIDDTEFRGTNEGTDLLVKGKSGFNATLGGWRTHDGEFVEMDLVATFWTSTQLSKTLAWGRGLEKGNKQISRLTFGKSLGFSVRCLKD